MSYLVPSAHSSREIAAAPCPDIVLEPSALIVFLPP